MAETYTPFTWVDGAGITEITAPRLNNIELGIESMDDRVTALEDAPPVLRSVIDAKGDLLAGTANDTVARVAAGANGTVLTADSTVAAGVAWATPAGGSTVTANTQTGTSYTLILDDAGKAVEMNNASANTFTVPPNSSVAFPVGTILEVYQMGAGQTTIAPGAGVTLRSSAGLKIRAQYSSAALRKRATDEWVVAGDLIP